MAEKWWSVKWRRVVLGIIVALGGLWLLTITTGHVMIWYEAKDIVKSEPRVALQPQVLRDTRAANLKDGTIVSHFGDSLQVPWTKTTVEKDFRTIYSVDFSDGSSLLMFDPAERQDLLTPYASNKPALSYLRSWLGDEAVRSHYDYAKTVVYAEPTEISLFHSRRTNAKAMFLLSMKSLEIPDRTTVVYAVSAPHCRGFQFGDPGKGPTFIDLLLFDDHDRGLNLIFKGPRGVTQPVLTQEQINGMIASAHAADQ
jgi:hypothetical protein